MNQVKLSICIPTLNRGKYIGASLDSLLLQLPPNTEIVVLDGASQDNTQEVMEAYSAKNPQIRYFREAKNSGVDADFDKAVGYACGEYCWLMTDDDLLAPDAIEKVLEATASNPELIVVNAELKSADFSIEFSERIVKAEDNVLYGPENTEAAFSELSNYLSFIGAVVIRRDIWLARDRESYYGSLFIHVGVIFQSPPLTKVTLIAEPLITIRYGNAMWTSRRFEIWMFMWPGLIWSFPDFPDSAKSAVSPREPWRSAKNILLYKAIGGYSLPEYHKFIAPRTTGIAGLGYKLMAASPASIVSFAAILYCLVVGGRNSPELYDISLSPNTGPLGRWLARLALPKQRPS